MLGIDVSKENLVCALRDASTRKILWDATVSNTQEGIATLLAKVPASTPWVLEPTGRYSLFVVKRAREAGKTVLLAPPRKAKAFLASIQSRAKTDKLDGRGLALFALSQPLVEYPVKEVAVDKIEQLLSARRGLSRCISKLNLQRGELTEAAEHLQGAVEDLKSRLKELDKQIASLSQQTPALKSAQALLAVPGIGPVTSVAVAARLSAKSFARPDQFVAYVGLDVNVAESGKHKGQRGLTHQGDAELRRLLYLCAQANQRCTSSPFKEQYERERAKGLSTTAALCAVARKIARLCWSLHKHGTTYDPARVGVQPIPAEARPLPVVLSAEGELP
jgi:transposase